MEICKSKFLEWWLEQLKDQAFKDSFKVCYVDVDLNLIIVSNNKICLNCSGIQSKALTGTTKLVEPKDIKFI